MPTTVDMFRCVIPVITHRTKNEVGVVLAVRRLGYTTSNGVVIDDGRWMAKSFHDSVDDALREYWKHKHLHWGNDWRIDEFIIDEPFPRGWERV